MYTCAQVHPSLQRLILADNKFGDRGAVGLADCLKLNSVLTHLNIGGNIQITATGAKSLAAALAININITYLEGPGGPLLPLNEREIARQNGMVI